MRQGVTLYPPMVCKLYYPLPLRLSRRNLGGKSLLTSASGRFLLSKEKKGGRKKVHLGADNDKLFNALVLEKGRPEEPPLFVSQNTKTGEPPVGISLS